MGIPSLNEHKYCIYPSLIKANGFSTYAFAVCEVQVHDSLQADTAIRQHAAATEMLKEQLFP